MKRLSIQPAIIHFQENEAGPPEVYQKLKPLIKRFGGDVPDLTHFDVLIYHEREGSLFIIRRLGIRCFAGAAVVGASAERGVWRTLVRLQNAEDGAIPDAPGMVPWIGMMPIDNDYETTALERARLSKFIGDLSFALVDYHRELKTKK